MGQDSSGNLAPVLWGIFVPVAHVLVQGLRYRLEHLPSKFLHGPKIIRVVISMKNVRIMLISDSDQKLKLGISSQENVHSNNWNMFKNFQQNLQVFIFFPNGTHMPQTPKSENILKVASRTRKGNFSLLRII